jgi:integrase
MPRQAKFPLINCKYFSWYFRKKSSGVWYADGRHNKGYDLGKPSLNTKDQYEARQRLIELDAYMAVQLGLASESHISSDATADLTLAEGWELYIERCRQPEILEGISARSCQRYQAVRDKHLTFCHNKGYRFWSDITKATTQKYGKWLAEQDYSDNTIVLELNLICAISKWHVEEQRLPPECRFFLKLSKSGETTTYCYSREQVTEMIKYCQSDPDLHWIGRVIVGLATSGMRINELAGLRWSDVDIASKTIRLSDERSRARRQQMGTERRLKGKRGRSIPMHPEFYRAIEGIPRSRDGLIFRGKMGGKIRDRRVLEVLQKNVIENLKSKFPTPPGEIGFANGTVHGLRHYFCSEAYRDGATDAELLDWLGHKDSVIMQRYRHLREEDSRRRMEQISFFDRGDEKDDTIKAANN